MLRFDALLAAAQARQLTALFKLFDGRGQQPLSLALATSTRRSSGQSGALPIAAPQHGANFH